MNWMVVAFLRFALCRCGAAERNKYQSWTALYDAWDLGNNSHKIHDYQMWTMPEVCRLDPCKQECTTEQSYDPKHIAWVKRKNKELGARKVGAFCNAKGSIQSIDVTYFGLNGSFPAALFQQTDLESVWMGGNNFEGVIPDAVVDLPHLETIDLSYNDFSLDKLGTGVKGGCAHNLLCYGMFPSTLIVPLQHEETCTAFGSSSVITLSLHGCKICSLSGVQNIVICVGIAIVLFAVFLLLRWLKSRASVNVKHTAASISILVSHASMFYVIEQMNLRWPESVSKMQVTASDIFGFNILDTFGAECVLRDRNIRVAYVAVVLYNGFVLFLFILLFGPRCIRMGLRKTCPTIDFSSEAFDKYVNICTMIFSMTATRVSQYFIADSNTRGDEEGGNSLGDLSRVLVGKIAFGVILFKLFREALVLSNVWDGHFLCLEKVELSKERLAVRLNYFSGRFAAHAPYYQLVLWGRQMCLLIFLKIFEGIFLGLISIAVCLASLYVHYKITPFEYAFQNKVEASLLWSLVVLLVVGTIFAAAANTSVYTEVFAYSVIGLTITSLVCAIVYLRLVQSCYRGFKQMMVVNTNPSSENNDDGEMPYYQELQ